MNALGLFLVWTAVQVSLLCLAGIGLYLVVRRHSPAAGAWAAGAALAATIVVSAIGISPWPRWWSLGDMAQQTPGVDSTSENPTDDSPGNRVADGSATNSPSSAPDSPAAEASKTLGADADWRSFLANLPSSAAAAGKSEGSGAWRWTAWLALAMLAGWTIGLARLLIAIAAVGHYRALTRRVSDPALLATLDQLRGELGCSREIDVREVSALCSPSTVGWLRPMIVLPGDWREWNASDQRAVLAHEVSHVARGDFATWLMAQFGVALHFYNPLVHWMARRLRLEQEMAADVCGAELAGGRQLYLTALAQMALRHDAPPASWAARPFLPTRGTLLRRIEMLHRQRRLPSRSVSPSRRAVMALLLALSACAIAGLRSPGEPRIASAAPPDSAATANTSAAALNLDYVPNDALVVFAARPAELAKLKTLAGIKKAVDALKVTEPLGIKIDELEEVKIVVSGGRTPKTRPWTLMMLRSFKPHDWTRLAANLIGPTESAITSGQEYFRAKDARPAGFSEYWLPDDRTIVVTWKGRVESTFSLRGPVNQPAWADKWQQVAGAPAAAFLSAAVFQPIVAEIYRGAGDEPPNVTELADWAIFKGEEVSGSFQMTGTATCRSVRSAQTVHSLAHKGLNLVRARLQSVSQRQPMDVISQIVLRLIDATKVDTSGETVQSRTVVGADLGMEFAKAVGPARLAAHRAQSQNKLKHIAIALHNYHDTHKTFPPAVIMGPDGKTPHSWRLELLPYMGDEKKDVYDRYKMDEPWDSPHNLKLIDEAADVFSAPGEPPSKDCGYFLLVGPGTVFDPDQPAPKIRNITDGTSNTIGVVEAKRKIPWTKPEDIAYGPDKPLPTLGGFLDGGFNAAYMDGSVHFLPTDLDDDTLRALISRAGREIINHDAGGRPAVQK